MDDQKKQKPEDPCQDCPYGEWQELYGEWVYCCDMSICRKALAEEEAIL